MLARTAKGVLALGLLLLGVVYSVESVPARARLPGHENLGDGADEAEDAGVLQRLWSGISTGFGSLAGFGKSDIEERMERFQSDSLDTLQNEIKTLLKVHRRQRRSRAHDKPLTRDDAGYYRLLDIDDNVNHYLKDFTAPENPISMVVFEHQNFIFWFITDSFTSNNPGRLHVYALQMGNFLQYESVDTMGAIKCVPILLMESFVEFACVESQGERATDKTKVGCGVYRLTWEGGLAVNFHRSLRTDGAHDVAIWQLGSNTYLAFANSYNKRLQTGEISNSLFKLQITTLGEKVYTTYDRLDSATFGSMNARGVEAFKIVSRQFLAVANHADDLGNVEIESDIFVYDVTRGSLKPFQRIRTSAASDWTAFSFVSGPNSEYFLAVANEYNYDEAGNKNFEVDSVIYKYDDGKFVPFQCIRTFGAKEWLYYQGPRSEFVLAVVNSQAGVFFYQYNGWRFVRSPFKVSTAGVERAWITYAPETLNKVILSVVNPFVDGGQPSVFYLTFEQQRPLSVYHDETLAWCESYKGSLYSLNTLVTSVRNAPRIDQPYSFSRPATIHGNLIVPAGAYLSEVRDIHVRIPDYSVDHSFTNFAGRIDGVNSAFERVSRAKVTLIQSRKLNSPNLDGLRFSNVEFKCMIGDHTGCKVGDLLVKTVCMKSKLKYLVTLSSNHNIVGEKTFGVLKANNLQVSGTVDSVRIDESELLLTVDYQKISSDITIESLSSHNIATTTLNGRDFQRFLKTLVLNNTSQHILGSLVVNGDLITQSIQVNVPAPLDPLSIVNRALFHTTEDSQKITGAVKIGGLTIQRGLSVWGRINGAMIPHEVFMRNYEETISVPTTFERLRADTLVVKQQLGNVKVINGELDLLFVNGDQEVVGKKSFVSMILRDHSSVAQTVSGYRLEDFGKILSTDFVTGVNSGRMINGSVDFLDKLYVKSGIVDGVKLSDIQNSAIPLDTRISSTFIFQGAVKVIGDFTVESELNGKKTENFVRKGISHIFTKNVTFNSDLKVEGNVLAESVNGFEFRKLVSRFVLKDEAQTIVSDVFVHKPVVSDVMVTGLVLIDDVDLYDTLLLTSTTSITGEKTFTTLKVLSGVTAGAVNIAPFGTVDDVDVDDLFGNSLQKSGTGIQHLVGRYINKLTASSVTGTDIDVLEKSIINMDSSMEHIVGSLTFTGSVTVLSLTFKIFDGVSAEEYSSSWLTKTASQSLTGVNVMQNVETEDLTFRGNLVNGVDLDYLVKNTAKIDEVTTLDLVSFDKIVSNSDVVLDGKIQGWDLSEEAVRANVFDQKVSGRKVFESPVRYSGIFSVTRDVVVKNYPDDYPLAIDIGGLCLSLGTPSTAIYLKNWTIRGDAYFGGSVTLTGSLNSENVATLEDFFWLTNVPNQIAAVGSFGSVILGVNANLMLDVMGKINDYNFDAVWDQMLKKECREQIVNAEFALDTLITHVLATNIIKNPADDVGVNELTNILLKDGYQEISGKLHVQRLEAKGGIILNGTVNGLRIDHDFVQYGKVATIMARKIFLEDLVIKGDLEVVDEGTIQGVDVSELGRLSLRKTNGEYKIPGLTTFKSLRYTGQDFYVYGSVDGVLVKRESLLLKSGYQEILGRLLINAGSSGIALEANSLVVLDNRLNQIDLNRLINVTVKMDTQSIIQQEITFLDICYFNILTLENHLINGYNITDLGLLINGNYLVNMGDHLTIALNVARDTKDLLAEKPAELWYFEETYMETVYKVLAVMLQGNYLEAKTYDTLVGLHRTFNLVYTFRMAPGFPMLYPAVSVLEPLSAAGLGSGLLATCGGQPMNATPAGVPVTSDFSLIPLESGSHSYGHIYSSVGEIGLEAAFGIVQCKHLVPYELNLGTKRAVKGAWMSLGHHTYLLVAEEETDFEPARLKLFEHNEHFDEMKLVSSTEVAGASDVDVLVLKSLAIVAVTTLPNRICNSSILIFSIKVDVKILEMESLQKLEIEGAVHSSLSLTTVGDIALFIQRREDLLVYYMKGVNFVFVRKIKTTPSLCPSSFPFLYGEQRELKIAYAGLGWLDEEYLEDKLEMVPSVVYTAVYRGTRNL
nr:uncharacterized protein LOC128706619 [Cherax quadricarinatus]